MATIYVSAATGNNTNNGTTWALAKQTVAGAMSGRTSGDIIVVDNAGTFTANTSYSWGQPPIFGYLSILSVLRSGTTGYSLAAGATEAMGTGTSFNTRANTGTGLYVWGMNLVGGTSTGGGFIFTTDNSVNCYFTAVNCTFTISVLSATFKFGFPAQRGQLLTFKDCTFNLNFGASSSSPFVQAGTEVEMKNCAFQMSAGTAVSDPFVTSGTGDHGSFTFRNCDLSTLGNCAAYTSVSPAQGSRFNFENCKTTAGVANFDSILSGDQSSKFFARNFDSGATNNTIIYQGIIGTFNGANTTTYVTSGGAIFSGTPTSWKVTPIGSVWPFEIPSLQIWCTTTTSQTLTIDLTSSVVLNDLDCWCELDYPSSASFPIYTTATTRNAQPGDPNNGGTTLTTSSTAWTNGLTHNYKLQITFTAAAPGLLECRIFFGTGTGSTILYVDPHIQGVT